MNDKVKNAVMLTAIFSPILIGCTIGHLMGGVFGSALGGFFGLWIMTSNATQPEFEYFLYWVEDNLT